MGRREARSGDGDGEVLTISAMLILITNQVRFLQIFFFMLFVVGGGDLK